MSERTVTMRGTALPLTGPELHVGEPAPNFLLQQRGPDGLQEITLEDFENKTLVLSVVPSLDTPVCSIQTKRFNEEAVNLRYDVEVLTVSMDLPFAQARFCTDNGVLNVKTASDHRDANFGRAYGTLIEDLRLESRAVFVIGPDKTLRYVEYVPEVTEEPNYAAALAVANEPND